MTIADFNGDGVGDSAVATSTGITVTLLNADGTTLSTSFYPVSGIGPSVLSADFNGDGFADLAVTQVDPSGQGNVVVLLGKGDGTFGQATKFPAGPFAFYMDTGDFNRDGIPDLAVTNSPSTIGTASTVSVLLGKGNGSFSSPGSYTVGEFPGTIVAADFNGDGKLDLAALDNVTGVAYLNKVWVLLGKGDGTFLPAVSTLTGTGSGYLAYTDLNHDGNLDLVIADQFASAAAIMMGNGDGTFQAATEYVMAAQPISIGILPLGDGNTLLSAADNVSQNVFNFFVTNDGTVAIPELQKIGSGPASIAAADLNGDGQPDLVITDSEAGSIYVELATGGGNFGSRATYSLGSQPGALALADVNGDGKIDVIAADATGIDVLLGNGNGTLQSVKTFPAGGGLSSVAVADFNLDGKPDVAAANAAAGGVSLFLGNGNGTFQGARTIPLANGLVALSAVSGDFNGDGKPDLIVSFRLADPTQPGGLAVFLGKGDGTFQTPTNITLLGPVIQKALVVGDFNSDGALDVATAIHGTLSNQVAVLLGNGNGTFKTPILTGTVTAPPMIAVTDLNGDGKPDLVLADCCGLSEATFMFGNGDGTFQPEEPFPSGSNPSGIAAADFNGDGLPDLAVIGQVMTPQYGTLTVMFNPGFSAGTKTSPAATTTIASAASTTFSPNAQTITLSATVTNNSTPVSGGTVSFTLLGTTVSGNVTSGSASASFTVPGGTAAGGYQIQAVYNPASGFATSSNSAQLTIAKATPVVMWSTPATIVSGMALSATQLDATANIPGAFAYTPPAGTVLPVGNNQTLSVLFTPTDATDYNTQTAMVSINVTAPPPNEFVFSWTANPAAGGSVTPASGTLFTAGTTITVTATPASACFTFSSFGGALSGSTNPSMLVLNAAESVVANFASTSKIDVTPQMKSTLSGFRYNRITQTYLQSLTVINNGAAVSGPVYVALDTLTTGTVLSGALGMTNCALPAGSPYVLLSKTGIGAGQTLTLSLQFGGTGGPPFVYKPRYLAGSGLQ